MIGTITLNPSIDQYIVVEGLHKDDTNRAKLIFRYAGGKGVNVSKVVKELGGRTFAYALIGGFTGEIHKAEMRSHRVPFFPEKISGETRINLVLTDRRDDTQTRISAGGPRVSDDELNRFLKKLLSVRPKPFFWALGGSLSLGMKVSTYQTFVSALQRNGTPCILDADNEALRLGILAKPFMIKPNEHEIQRLVNRSLKRLEDYEKAAHNLIKGGISIVVVSLGARGALFATEKQTIYVSTPHVEVKSKVGAGDSLIGGFSLGLYRKMGLVQAARLGVAASTSAVIRETPRLCWRKDIPRILPRIRARSV